MYPKTLSQATRNSASIQKPPSMFGKLERTGMELSYCQHREDRDTGTAVSLLERARGRRLQRLRQGSESVEWVL